LGQECCSIDGRELVYTLPPPKRELPVKVSSELHYFVGNRQMSQVVIEALKPFCESPPVDLVSHFTGDHFPLDPELAINILRIRSAVEYTGGIHRFAILGPRLGLVALDDGNNSNPFCYITKGPVRGCVMQLRHDDDAVIAFSSLRGFMAVVDAAIVNRVHIDDITFDEAHSGLDRAGVVDHLMGLGDDDEAVVEICALMPLISTNELELIEKLSYHVDFFVREAIANAIIARPNPALSRVAERLASDPHPQVSRPGQLAMAAVIRAI
jgi:hypothetical protein